MNRGPRYKRGGESKEGRGVHLTVETCCKIQSRVNTKTRYDARSLILSKTAEESAKSANVSVSIG